MNADSYKPMIVAYRNGRPVRLSDVGTVIDSVENDKIAAYYINAEKFERSVILAIQRQPGTNTVAVVDAVKALLPSFRAQLPASVSINDLYDRSISIRDSVNDVKFTLVLTLCLVILVIFLFLRSFWATTIPSIAMPMSVVGTFIVMSLMGYSLDNLSLMALTLSVGFVVDDAIVMLENIVRHMEMGEPRLQAAFSGSQEVSFTILSMTLSLAAVFIPILFMGGLVGRLFHEFAVTIGAAILVSGVVSLTLTPMLCSRFLKAGGEAHHGRIYAASEKVFDGMLWLYETGLRWALRHRLTTMFFSLLVLAGTVLLFMVVPKGFLPSEDTARFIGYTEGAQGISFEAMTRAQNEIARIVREDPNVDSFMSFIGRTPNGGIIFVRLKPRKQRPLGVEDVINELRPKVNQVTGMTTFMFNPPAIQTSGRMTKSQYQYTIQGPDTEQMFKVAPAMAEKMKQIPGLVDVTTDLQLANPQVNVTIDRDKASALGITAGQIENALGAAYGSQQYSTIYASTNQYQVIVELQPQFRSDPDELAMIYVRSSVNGQLVPLNTLASITKTLGPLTVNHTGQLPSVTVSFNLKPGVPLGPAVDAVNKLGHRDPARQLHHGLSGNRPGVPIGDGRPGAAPGPGDRGDLHGPGHPLRVLHPPADDPVGAAVRRLRRPGHPVVVPRRAQHLRVRRHHHAGGPGEKERHHDDRLRHRRPTDRGQEPPGRHLRGVRHPVPADHDDHDGRPDGHPADRHRLRRRGRVAPAPGPGGRRRPAVQPGPDALRHAGVLPLHGVAAPLAGRGEARAVRADSGQGASTGYRRKGIGPGPETAAVPQHASSCRTWRSLPTATGETDHLLHVYRRAIHTVIAPGLRLSHRQ